MAQNLVKNWRFTITASLTMSNYSYYNRNPANVDISDCVYRAISTATGLDYDATARLLNYVAKERNCDKLCVCCYNQVLKSMFGYKRYTCKNEETVNDIARRHSDKKVIIRIHQHLTVSVYGEIKDTWDCGDKYVDCYWIVE